MKEGDTQYINLQVKRWRALTYDYEKIMQAGDNSCLYCLTDSQVMWILSNTEYIRWQTRWDNFTGQQDQLDTFKSDLEHKLMSCVDITSEQLQYITQSIETQQLSQFKAGYDATGIAGVNVLAPTDFYNGDNSPARNSALCMAVTNYVKVFIQGYLDKAKLIQAGLIYSSIIILPVPILGFFAYSMVNALAGINQEKITACEDEQAVDNVICCMIEGLTGLAVNETVFSQSLDSCGYLPASNSELVREIVASDLSLFSNWLTFLNLLGEAYLYTNAGVEFDCPCEQTWEHTFDFAIDEQGWVKVVTSGYTPTTRGAYNAIEGAWLDTSSQSAFNKYQGVEIEVFIPATQINKIEINFDAIRGNFDKTNDDSRVYLFDGVNQVSDEIIIEAIQTGVGQTKIVDYGALISMDRIRLNLICDHDNPNQPVNGSISLFNVTVYGVGTNPF